MAYRRKLKQQLREEGNEAVTNCHGLRLVNIHSKFIIFGLKLIR